MKNCLILQIIVVIVFVLVNAGGTMKKQEIDNCMFSNWYSKFKEHTIKSVVIPLEDEDFISYLTKDSPLILPPGFELPSINSNQVCPVYSDDSDNEDWSDEESATHPADEQKEFPYILEQIKSAINRLGGVVFPKLGWSSPKDADWVLSSSSFKCTTPGEIVMLIKSSTFTTYDLTSPYGLCEDVESPKPDKYELVIRKWMDIHPGSEFRCFVKNKKLIGITQRQHRVEYKHIIKEKEEITQEIHQFINHIIINQFPSQSFVVDLSRSQTTRNGFRIVDFNPFGEMTDSLLFEWSELIEGKFSENKNSIDILNSDGVSCGQFRFVGQHQSIQPSDYLRYGMPQDFYDLSVGNDATKLVDFLRMKTQNQPDSSEDEDEMWRLPPPPATDDADDEQS